MATTGKAPGKTLAGQDGSGVATLELERFLPYRLSLLSNRISQTIADLYAERFGIYDNMPPLLSFWWPGQRCAAGTPRMT